MAQTTSDSILGVIRQQS